MKSALIFFVLLLSIASNSQNIALPVPFNNAFKTLQLDKKYEGSNLLTPGFLQADFNGDNVPDLAVLVSEKETNKLGVVILHGNSNKYFVFGAGTKFEGAASDNLSWAEKWALYTKNTATQVEFDDESGEPKKPKQISLGHPGLLIAETDDELSGGIIYWNGEKYIWISQGED